MSHSKAASEVTIKRAYEPRSPHDGTRVLVDRLWPRGVKKAKAGISQWMKEIAPSNELRKWFGHDPGALGGVPPPLQARSSRASGSW